MRRIKLTQGKVSLIDECDFLLISKHKWRVTKTNPTSKTWYAMATIKFPSGNWETVYMHRFLTNAPAGVEVDHINGSGLDNRRGNLRVCSRTQNRMNTFSRKHTSRYKGVGFSKKLPKESPWTARLGIDGKMIYLGGFKTQREAALAYNHAALERYGEFAKLNEVAREA